MYWLHDKDQSIILFKNFNYLKMMISKRHLEFRSTQIQPSESRSVITDSLQPHGLYSPWNSLGQNTGVGSLSLLQNITILNAFLSHKLRNCVSSYYHR